MRLWVDDLREPPDHSWYWAQTSGNAICMLEAWDVEEMSLDHDLGGEDTTRNIVMWLSYRMADMSPGFHRVNRGKWPPVILTPASHRSNKRCLQIPRDVYVIPDSSKDSPCLTCGKKPARPARCHPDRERYVSEAKGALCQMCYRNERKRMKEGK